MTESGCKVVSLDPIYQFSDHQIQQRIKDTFEGMMKQLDENKEKFTWENISSIEELRNLRQTAMGLFIEDYNNGKHEKDTYLERYQSCPLIQVVLI